VNDGNFKVWEIAIFQNLPFPFDHLNTKETKILDTLRSMDVVDIFGTPANKPVYLVFAANREFACDPAFLKKKPKPAVHRELELAEA
jgi:hypothetical protein